MKSNHLLKLLWTKNQHSQSKRHLNKMKTLGRPTIAITGPNAGGFPAWFFSQALVRLYGGRPIRLSPDRNWNEVDFDGLIIGGGADIDTRHYQTKTITPINNKRTQDATLFKRFVAMIILKLRIFFSLPSSRGRIDLARDEMELELLKKVVEEKKPVLGICRGMQLINVYFKGKLHTNIRDFYTTTPQIRSVLPKKNIDIEEHSNLFNVLGTSRVKVNALHDQAISIIGQGLKSVAKEKSGIIQAIESKKSESIIGVQWHPEFLPQYATHRKLFRWLVDTARELKKY